MQQITLTFSLKALVLLIALFMATNAQSGWLDDIFGPSDCELLDEADLLLLGGCEKSVKSFQESGIIDYPDYNERTALATPGLSLTRVSDNPSSTDEEKKSFVLRHHYSKRQAWNLDESLIDLGERIVRQEDYQPLLDYEPLSSARNWSNIKSDVLIGVHYNPLPNVLVEFNVKSEEYKTIREFSDYDKCSFGKGEGNLSNNDSLLLLSCISQNTGDLTLIAYDLKNDQILGTLIAEENFNWASFSQSGRYVLVENNEHPDPKPELIRYTPELTNPVVLSVDPAHGDLGIDHYGNDVYVMIYSRHIESINLTNGKKLLLKIGGRGESGLGSGHVSCRAFLRPGWCYISSYTAKRLGAVFVSELQEIDSMSGGSYFKNKPIEGPAAYEHWEYHRSTIDSYRVISKATVNRSGTSILFTSDWYGEQPANDFVLEWSKQEIAK